MPTKPQAQPWYHQVYPYLLTIGCMALVFTFMGLYLWADNDYKINDRISSLTHRYNCRLINVTYIDCEYCTQTGENGCQSYGDGFRLNEMFLTQNISLNTSICHGDTWNREQNCRKKQKSSVYDIGEQLNCWTDKTCRKYTDIDPKVSAKKASDADDLRGIFLGFMILSLIVTVPAFVFLYLKCKYDFLNGSKVQVHETHLGLPGPESPKSENSTN